MKKNVCVILLIMGSIAGVQAGTVWDGGGANSSWGTAANWNGDVLPSFNGTDALNFGSGFGSGIALTLDGDRTISSLTLTSAVFLVINSGSPAGKLTLASGNVSSLGVAKNQTHNEDIILGASGTFNSSGAANTTNIFNGVISESTPNCSITKGGARYLALNGPNTFRGGVVVAGGSGATTIGHNQALGFGTLRLNSSSIFGAIPTCTITNNVDIMGSCTIGVGGNKGLVMNGPGIVTLKGDATITATQDSTAGNDLIFNNGIAEDGTPRNLTLGGSRSVILNGTSTFSGTLTISGAILTAGGQMATTNVVASSGFLFLSTNNPIGIGTLTFPGISTITNKIGTMPSGGPRRDLDNTIFWKGTVSSPSVDFSCDLNRNGGSSTLTGDLTMDFGFLNTFADRAPCFWRGLQETGGSWGVTLIGGQNRYLMLRGVSTYSGPTTISSGILQMVDTNALPTNTAVSITFFSTSSGVLALNGYPTQIGSLAGSGYVFLDGGTLTVSGPPNTVYSGYFSSSTGVARAGSLVKDGTGVLRLTANTNINYTSGTTIKGGTLQVDGLISAATGTVNVIGGLLCGTGRVNRAVNVQPGGSINGGFGTNLIGALTTGNLGFSNTASLVWAVDPTTNSVLVSTNTLTQSGTCTLKVYNLGRTIAPSDVFPVIRYAGALNGFVPADWTIDLTASPTVTASRSARLYSSSGVIYLTGLQSPASPSGTVILIR